MQARAFEFFDPPTLDAEVEGMLNTLAAGGYDPDRIETASIDLKEEAGRRSNGAVRPGPPQNEPAARQLAEAAACMANTEGGGALIVGVDGRTGEIIGADTDHGWLRSRIYELTGRKLTVNIRVAGVSGKRLLVIFVPQAVEPVAFKGKYRHRLGKACVEVTSTELLRGIFAGAAADPSYQRSSTPADAVSPRTEAALRGRLTQINPDKAALPLRDLLTRLGLIFEDTEYLNDAGRILLAADRHPALDYTYREVPGGPSNVRIYETGLSLLEEIELVAAEANRNNPVTAIIDGPAVHRERAIPERSLREAILNGVCHRDWTDPAPTVVEHIGYQLRVTSPGGLIRGITVDNIITHPSVPRYRTLMNAFRQLELVEQEGAGVDMMFADLIRIGSTPPLIEPTDDPSVRVILSGRRPDKERYRFFLDLRPRRAFNDADAALAVWRASQPGTPFLTAASCASLLQRNQDDAETALHRVAGYKLGGIQELLTPMTTPADSPPAWVLSLAAREALRTKPPRDPFTPAMAWLSERGRISSTEYRELTGFSHGTAVAHLKNYAEAGHAKPSWPSGRGRGFHYLLPDDLQGT